MVKRYLLILILAISLPAISKGSFAPEDEAVIKNITNAMTSFTLKFEKVFSGESDKRNHFFSPIVIFRSLYLVCMGASGETRDELADVLGLPRDETRASAALNTFASFLSSLQNSLSPNANFVTGLFVESGTGLNDEFVRKALLKFNSDVKNLNFHTPDSTLFINNWVDTNTGGRIPKFVPESVPRNTKMLVASAMTMSTNWANKFDPSKTSKGEFSTGSSVMEITMMSNVAKIPYYDNSTGEFTAIGLPDEHKQTSLYFLLPYESKTLSQVLDDLQHHQLHEIVELAQQNLTNVLYKVPRTNGKCIWNHVVNDALRKVGLEKLFSSANFSRIFHDSASGSSQLNFQHATEVETDETGVCNEPSSLSFNNVPVAGAPTLPPVLATFYTNRPFLFYFYHHASKCIISFGQVYHPGLPMN